MAKKVKKIKIWNGRGRGNGEHLFIGAYSKADACRMLDELYTPFSKSYWKREMTTYFVEGCWGNPMEGITPERGVWLLQNEYTKNKILTRIYPIKKGELND
jgi:hypothetical protein